MRYKGCIRYSDYRKVYAALETLYPSSAKKGVLVLLLILLAAGYASAFYALAMETALAISLLLTEAAVLIGLSAFKPLGEESYWNKLSPSHGELNDEIVTCQIKKSEMTVPLKDASGYLELPDVLVVVVNRRSSFSFCPQMFGTQTDWIDCSSLIRGKLARLEAA